MDIGETDKEYVVKAELPEVKKEDVKVTLEEGVLTIQGERRLEKEEKGKRSTGSRRAYGKFLRTFTVPRDVDEKKILAEFKEGVLSGWQRRHRGGSQAMQYEGREEASRNPGCRAPGDSELGPCVVAGIPRGGIIVARRDRRRSLALL